MPTIAIIGASQDRSKYGNRCVRAYRRAGYDVFPIHPKESFIEGLPCYASIAAVPSASLDRISIYLPEAICLTVLPELAAKSAKQVWLNPGADSPAVITLAKSLKLPIICGCSIVAIGIDPHDVDDSGE